jgi:capsular polysaccharide export protein
LPNAPPSQWRKDVGEDLQQAGPASRHFLLLRGPFGPFYHQLAAALKTAGAKVSKVNFDTGDEVIWGINPGGIRCPAGPGEMGRWLADFMIEEKVTDLVCFNDCVEPHGEAIAWARDAGLSVHVFEEGYFRPHWITLDSGGVNVRSALPRDPEIYRQDFDKSQADPTVARDVGLITRGLVYATICHYLGKTALTVVAGPSPTPYAISTRSQMFGYIRMYFRRVLGMNSWPRVEAELLSGAYPYYLGLVQKAGDTQLTHNSDYDNESFILAVLDDFARNAPAGTRLAFKLHPMEPRMREQERFIQKKARAAGLSDRVLVLDGGNLNALARQSRGAVTINSTAGLAAIGFGCPVKVMGRALYDIPGLTHQGDLAGFWNQPQLPDMSLFSAFRWTVMARTQINGSFFTPLGRQLAIEGALRKLLAPR